MPAVISNIAQLREPSDYVNSLSLVANTSERIPIPTGRTFAVFSCTSNYYVKVGDSSVAAAVPSDVTDGTASELNPASFILPESNSYTHIAICTPVNAICTVSFYEVR
ncbi:MAG: hypothetical protein C0446_08375 [Chitinophaga sp.]|nr:hypothetical protein [Chitinophaga sp.]